MRPLPFTEVPAEIVFIVAIAFFALVQLISGRGTIRFGRSRSAANGFDRGSLLVVIAGFAAGILLGEWAAENVLAATIGDGHPVVRALVFGIGIAVIVLGTALRLWAVLELGHSFTLVVRVTPGQKVISTGPYRFVRHPSYTGLLLSIAGVGLVLGNWISFAALVILPTAGTIWRIFVEEAALSVQLGEPYREFAATRKRLVPGVW